MNLPIFQDDNKNVVMLQNRWASILNPVIKNPLSASLLLSDITLKTGQNVVNHRLGRALQGYIVVLNNASATFFDSQSTNSTPDVTLLLTASAPCTISMLVF